MILFNNWVRNNYCYIVIVSPFNINFCLGGEYEE